MQTIKSLLDGLEAGRVTSRGLVEAYLAKAQAPGGQGAKSFVKLNPDEARADADRADLIRSQGRMASRFCGLPFAYKDLFDAAGEVTTAGSTTLQAAAPARTDCDAIARLRAAGMVPIGRTNMVEFAYGGVGTNPHFGTPLSVYERDRGRIPGGSSSGSAVAVADEMCPMALGSDTGGSCRVPAAFNAITGYKPTARRVSLRGVFPLSPSFDSVGPLAPSVQCCAYIDALLAGDWAGDIATRSIEGLRLGVPQNLVLEGMDASVAEAFASALSRLSRAGARLTDMRLGVLDSYREVTARGGIPAMEAWAGHRKRLKEHFGRYDPRVSKRIQTAAGRDAADYLDLLERRKSMVRQADREANAFDALLMPTVPVVPPLLADVQSEEDYFQVNGLILRNTSIANFLDCCAISIPISNPAEPPVGLMVYGRKGGDVDLFSVAASIEATLSSNTG